MNASLPPLFSIVFAVVALVASVLYGCYAVAVFCDPLLKLTKPQRIHQRWFNFVGSAVGWTAAYGLVLKTYRVLWHSQPLNFTFGHGLIFLVAFAGITGHLPRTLFATFRVIDNLIAKTVAKVTGTHE